MFLLKICEYILKSNSMRTLIRKNKFSLPYPFPATFNALMVSLATSVFLTYMLEQAGFPGKQTLRQTLS